MLKPVLCAAVLTLTAQVAAAAPPPVADVRNVPQVFHGVTVDDPYRWLEDVQSPQARAWYQGQGDAARSVLDRIEGRDATARRLAELADARGDAIGDVLCMPGQRFYYLKRAPGEPQFRLMLRQGLDGAETVLVDPQQATARTGVPHAVNYYRPSWDGRYVAYGMSAGGSEDATLHVLDVASGKLVGQPQPRVQEGLVHWLPDSRSLTFSQLAPPKAGAPATDHYKDSRSMWLKVGAAAPLPVFGPTVTRTLGLARLDVAQLITVPGSPWVVARTTDTTVPEGKIFVAPLSRMGRADMRWKRVASESDKVYSAQLAGDALYLVTQADAPRRKLVKVDLRRPDLARAELVVAEPDGGALENVAITPGGVVAEVRQGTQVLLRRYAAGDTAGRALPMPGAGAAGLLPNPTHDSDALYYRFSSWTEPVRTFRLDRDGAAEVALGRRVVPPGLPQVEVTDVMVTSHDGVPVPMTILHRKGLALDGSNPVLLNGYASYGSTISAGFSTETMAWIERGGVAAFVNPRGSGAYGDAWHRAGFKTTKPNTWKDGIAAAKYLIAKGYGSPRTMGIIGGSAGGIFVGRATTEAPELFAAAVYAVGSLDTVRAETTANGATNTSEFGTVADPAEFKALLEMSTYHAIRDGVRYPGVLLVHGMNDPRVDVWESGKTAARLQAAQAGVADPRPALLRLDAQAGHGVGSTVPQRQAMSADIQSFLLWQMGKTTLKD